MIDFNLNDCVLVKLTDEGRAELERQWAEVLERIPEENRHLFKKEYAVDDNGYTRFQAHDLIYRLGHMLRLASPLPFDLNIKLDVKRQGND